MSQTALNSPYNWQSPLSTLVWRLPSCLTLRLPHMGNCGVGTLFQTYTLPHPLNDWCLWCWLWAFFGDKAEQVHALQVCRVQPNTCLYNSLRSLKNRCMTILLICFCYKSFNQPFSHKILFLFYERTSKGCIFFSTCQYSIHVICFSCQQTGIEKWKLLSCVWLFETPLVCGILLARILEWVVFPFSRGIFLTQGSNPGLPHCRQILYQLSHRGSDSSLNFCFL